MRRCLHGGMCLTGNILFLLLFTVFQLNAQCPDPGEVTVCSGTNDVINLLDLIEGEEPGGEWMRVSGMGGIFNPVNGTYTITNDADTSAFTYTYEEEEAEDEECEVLITVNVSSDPLYNPVCLSLSIGISDGNPDLIDADSLISLSKYDCDKVLHVQARRLEMEAACGYAKNLILSDSVGFCCEDVGNTVMVQVVAKYLSGHEESCMAAVTVTDKAAPILVDPPSDVTISCEYPLDTGNMSVFGWFAFFPEMPETYEINDPGQDENPTVTEGKIIENCPENIIIDTRIVDLRDCGMGDILRIFSIYDPGSDENSVDTQTITIENYNPFVEEYITWPKDTMIESCDVMVGDESQTGKPVFLVTNTCSMPMMTSSDIVFDDPNSGCLVIERFWKVVDWCQYDGRGSGEWTHRQYIKLKNFNPPEIINFVDTLELCTPFGSCEGIMDISLDATDDCTEYENLKIFYVIDLYNDSSTEISSHGHSIKESLPRGQHKIYWKVNDRCGNNTDTVQIVNIRECKAPTPVCLQGIAITLSTDGEVEIWASDFNNHSTDNCTPKEQLVYSFSEDPDDGFRVFDCDDIGKVELEVWVTDLDGNQNYCLTSVDIQDNLNICDNGEMGPTSAMISGHVYSEMNTPIDDTQINISGPEMDDYCMTKDGGKYAFEELPIEYEYEIIPTKDDYPLAGVTTLDIVKIQRHILGIQPFDSPYKMIAADVNNSQSITAGDLIQLRKLILGIHDHFPENNSWRFVESQYGIIEYDNPWPFIEGMFVPKLSDDIMEGDFVGIKVGDVDNTVEGNLKRGDFNSRSIEKLIITAKDRKIAVGEVVDVTLQINDIYSLIAMQWTLSFDDEKVKIVNWETGSLPLTNDQMAIIHGEGIHFTLAWNDLDGAYLTSGNALITLTIEATENIQLSDVMFFGSTITKAVAYDKTDSELSLELEWITEPGDVILYQNAPNPFIDHTYISFDMPEEGQANLIISDISGRVLHQISNAYPAGRNKLIIIADDLQVPAGVLYYTLNYAGQSLTKKMILLK